MDLDTRTVVSGATLTESYVTQTAPTYIELESCDSVALDVAYTMGAAETANTLQLKIEYASPLNDNNVPVATDWYTTTAEATVAGVTTLTLQSYTFAATQVAATYDRFVIYLPVIGKYMRVSYKETGIAANGGTLSIKATLRRDQTLI